MNNTLFNLDTPNNPLDMRDNFFFSKNDIENDSVYFKISKDSNYQLYTLQDNKPKSLNFQDNFGNFLVVNNSIIFEKNDNNYLYLHDLNNGKEICLFDQKQISDFALLKNSIVAVNTNDSIYFIDMKENKIIDSIDKKEHSLENTIVWIYSDGIDQIYLIDHKNIYKIKLNL